MPSNTPSYEKWHEFPTKVMFLIVWSIPVCIGFVASMIWQGLVIGWNACNALLERT